jgi:hypothetical protein
MGDLSIVLNGSPPREIRPDQNRSRTSFTDRWSSGSHGLEAPCVGETLDMAFRVAIKSKVSWWAATANGFTMTMVISPDSASNRVNRRAISSVG